MAIKFNGGFKVGGVDYRHPLDTAQIQFLLELLASTTFTGKDIQIVFEIAYLLQEEYKRVSEKKQQTN